MEWVEITGRTVEEAKDAALDQLGVDERDAEFDIVEEARSGLFGRLRQEARVRARVRPTAPRPKGDRRERRRRGPDDREVSPSASPQANAPPRRRSSGGDRPFEAGTNRPADPEAGLSADEVGQTQEEQGESARAFLAGLAVAFGVQGQAEVDQIDEDLIEARLTGDGLGLLIGPKGQTLAAVQELTRAAVQRGPRRGSRLRVDVGGYQQRRRAALERFTHEVAAKVRATGVATLLEPMPAADRKVVHDTVNTIEGVQTRSEGEDPHRQVLITAEPEVRP